MPELPDIEQYLNALHKRIYAHRLVSVKIQSPFLLRTVEPSLDDVAARNVVDLRRIGKRIAIGLEDDYWLVIHLMIAGRFSWNDDAQKKLAKKALAAFIFDSGQLILTEAGTKKRASLHVLRGEEALAALDPRGLEVLDLGLEDFAERLCLRNHTLKRALTDPRLFSGIGNAYSDEILHHAKLSPIAQTHKLQPDEIAILHASIKTVLGDWLDRLARQCGDKFPSKVTAFRPEMSVHGRFGQACPVCETIVQRIRYANNEVNYCPRCQTNGRVLADRSLSRLLKKDWPRTIEELEALKADT